MNASTITSERTLEIDGMTGDVCVQKVKGVLKDVPGVATQSVSIGSAVVDCDDTSCKAACDAVKRSGYPCREDATAQRTNQPVNAQPKTSANERSGNAFNTPAPVPGQASHHQAAPARAKG